MALTGIAHKSLQEHLFPGDNKEAVSVCLCSMGKSDQDYKLIIQETFNIPYEECSIRREDLVNWKTEKILPLLTKAQKEGLAVLKIHSHPSGYGDFSETDDISDKDLFDSVYGWIDGDIVHASAVMLPNGEIFGRIVDSDLNFIRIDKIIVASSDIKIWTNRTVQTDQEELLRTKQAFGEGTTSLLRSLKIGVVGCSGTGSPTIEQLARLGVGELVIIDPDVVERKNLNRILNTTSHDADQNRFKVNVIKEAINKMGLGTKVLEFNQNLYDSEEAIRALSTCDMLFGCVDSVDGRHLLNQIANFYCLPYFDLGVKLTADGKGGIDHIHGTIHYVLPGGSSLMSRGVYDSEDLRAALMYRTDSAEFENLIESGYIRGVNVNSPAVISVNLQLSSMAINEFLCRIHRIRYEDNDQFYVLRLSITDSYIQNQGDSEPDPYFIKYSCRGDISPLLNMPQFS